MSRLYDLTTQYMELLAALEREAQLAAEGEDEEELLEVARVIDERLEELKWDIREKIDGYGQVMREIQEQIEALRREEKALAEKRARAERALARLRSGVQAALEALEAGGDEPVVRGKIWTARLRTSTAVEVLDERKLVEMGYGECRETYVVDKRAILARWREAPDEFEGLASVVRRRHVELR